MDPTRKSIAYRERLRDYFLLLHLFVLSLRTAPLAPFFEFDFALDELAILARPIVDAVAFGAGKLN